MDQLEQWRLFIAVAEAGSFVEAARRLRLSPAAASRAILSFENRLGVKLFHRTTRKVALTDSGRGFLDRARGLLSDVDEAEASLQGDAASVRGAVRIGAPMSFGIRHLGPLVASFLAANPEARVELDLSDRVFDPREEGLDLTVRIADRIATEDWIAVNVGAIPRVLCATPRWVERHGAPRTPNEIGGKNALVYRSAGGIETQRPTWRFRRGNETQAVVPVGNFVVNNSFVIRDALLAGTGLSLIPQYLVADDLKKGKLLTLLPRWIPDGHQLFLLYPPRRFLTPRVRAFAEHLQRELTAP